MYKNIFLTQPGAIDPTSKRIFVPQLVTHSIHSIQITPVGGPKQIEELDFRIETPFVRWIDLSIAAALTDNDTCLIEIEYFYKGSEYSPEAKDLANRIVSDSLAAAPTATQQSVLSKRADIFLKHYIDSQFALDSGLYKESVINAGTVVEALLNAQLDNTRLVDLINNNPIAQPVIADLHTVRDLRNRVHPNVISNFADVSRSDALFCRNIVNAFINTFAQHGSY